MWGGRGGDTYLLPISTRPPLFAVAPRGGANGLLLRPLYTFTGGSGPSRNTAIGSSFSGSIPPPAIEPRDAITVDRRASASIHAASESHRTCALQRIAVMASLCASSATSTDDIAIAINSHAAQRRPPSRAAAVCCCEDLAVRQNQILRVPPGRAAAPPPQEGTWLNLVPQPSRRDSDNDSSSPPSCSRAHGSTCTRPSTGTSLPLHQ